MDIRPTSQQSISDDQELAKVLAGVNQQVDDTASEPVVPPLPPVDTTAIDESVADDSASVAPEEPSPALEPAVDSSYSAMAPTMSDNSDLESIKKEALGELRPLVDKLDVNPEEKFDTYLLLLRSTDDKALIAPAHDAAKSITDESRRAQALLDIIKEIDFLSQGQK